MRSDPVASLAGDPHDFWVTQIRTSLHGRVVENRFRERYVDAAPTDLPWYHPEPDLAVVSWFEAHDPRGWKIIDIGAGPAVHSIWFAQQGHEVTCVDEVPEAKTMALAIAKDKGATLEYITENALDHQPASRYDLVFDRGFLHTLEVEDRARWRDLVLRCLQPGGRVLMICFSRYPKREFGPTGLTALEVTELLGDETEGLVVESITRSSFNLSIDDPDDHATWFLVARRS